MIYSLTHVLFGSVLISKCLQNFPDTLLLLIPRLVLWVKEHTLNYLNSLTLTEAYFMAQ